MFENCWFLVVNVPFMMIIFLQLDQWFFWAKFCIVINFLGEKIDIFITRILCHHGKSCSSKPHYLATRLPKQLIYNYITTRIWHKSKQLIIKCHARKSRSCTIVANGTHIWFNVCIIHTNVVNHVWFFWQVPL
jgi:hypothetical protein